MNPSAVRSGSQISSPETTHSMDTPGFEDGYEQFPESNTTPCCHETNCCDDAGGCHICGGTTCNSCCLASIIPCVLAYDTARLVKNTSGPASDNMCIRYPAIPLVTSLLGTGFIAGPALGGATGAAGAVSGLLGLLVPLTTMWISQDIRNGKAKPGICYIALCHSCAATDLFTYANEVATPQRQTVFWYGNPFTTPCCPVCPIPSKKP
jgi:hypothetical protein